MGRHSGNPPWAKNPGYRGAYSKDDGQPLGTGGGGWFRTGQGPGGNETHGGSWGSHRAPGPPDRAPKRGLFGKVPDPKPLFGGGKAKGGKSGGGGTVGKSGLTRDQLNHPFGGKGGKR